MNFTDSLNAYYELCHKRLLPYVDRMPAPDIAVNPVIKYRQLFEELEKSDEFHTAAEVFGDIIPTPVAKAAVPTHGKGHYRLHLAAFFRNTGIYEDLIRGVNSWNAQRVSQQITEELNRQDTKIIEVGFLENFSCEIDNIDCEDFSIRHLTQQEIRKIFIGIGELDWHEDPDIILRAMKNEFFIVRESAALSFEEQLLPVNQQPYPLKSHWMQYSLCDIYLALNLFCKAFFPLIFRKAYSWNTSLFCRGVKKYPEPDEDSYPSSWGGTEDAPRIRSYVLKREDVAQIKNFWQKFMTNFLDIKAEYHWYIPDYLHRAVRYFLAANQWKRNDWEMRRFLYIASLEALYCGNDEERIRPLKHCKEEGREGVKSVLSSCCARLLGQSIEEKYINNWIFFLAYGERSMFAHGSASGNIRDICKPWVESEFNSEQNIINRLNELDKILKEFADISKELDQNLKERWIKKVVHDLKLKDLSNSTERDANFENCHNYLWQEYTICLCRLLKIDLSEIVESADFGIAILFHLCQESILRFATLCKNVVDSDEFSEILEKKIYIRECLDELHNKERRDCIKKLYFYEANLMEREQKEKYRREIRNETEFEQLPE